MHYVISACENNYAYDAAGQLSADEQEEIESIEWTHEGKVKRVNRTSESTKAGLEFLYDASGSRICKIVKPKFRDESQWRYTWYVRDADGNVLTTYGQRFVPTAEPELCDEMEFVPSETNYIAQTEVHLYGSSRLGVWKMDRRMTQRRGLTYECEDDVIVWESLYNHNDKPDLLVETDIFTFDRGDKRYEISNHLGNVLAVVGDRKIVVTLPPSDPPVSPDPNLWLFDHYLADLWSVSDYHPFGMAVEERSWAAEEYRFGFNGKENDAEWDAQDYGGRIYMPKQARWISPDPLAEKFTTLSAYSYVANRPINAIDPDGRDIIVLFAKFNVSGFGHAAVLIGNDKDGWYLYSKNGTDEKSGIKGAHRPIGTPHAPEVGVRYNSIYDFIASKQLIPSHLGGGGYTHGIRIKTSSDIDTEMKAAAEKQVTSDYSLMNSNCVDLCSYVLSSGGLSGGNTDKPVPNDRYKSILNENTNSSEMDLLYMRFLVDRAERKKANYGFARDLPYQSAISIWKEMSGMLLDHNTSQTDRQTKSKKKQEYVPKQGRDRKF